MDSALLECDELLKALPVGVLILDSGWKVRLHNDLALKLLALEVTDLLSDDLEKTVQNTEFKACLAGLKENDLTRAQVSFDIHSRRVNCVAKRIRFQERDGVVITLEDVTRVKEFEVFKHEFIENILQRLRNPLSTLETTLAIVTSEKAGKLEPQTKKILEMSYHEVIRLHSLSRDLRDLFFIETGLMRKELEIEECEIGKALERALAEIGRMPPPFDTVRQRVRIEGRTESTVEADFDKLKQILINLLKNAVQFSSGQDPIYVRITDHSGCISIQIQDHGIGISNEKVGFVFDKFFREDNPVTRKIPGNGLGLFNAKALAELMGGVVYCESEREKGSSFWFNIPAKLKSRCCVEA